MFISNVTFEEYAPKHKAPEHSPNCAEFSRCFCPAWFYENS